MESGCPDIIVNGYFKNDDFKNVYMDHVNNYYNLEYYTDELKGTQKVLKPISAYMKGEIDFLYLLNAYTVIMQESEAAGMREYLKHYDEWYKNVLLK